LTVDSCSNRRFFHSTPILFSRSLFIFSFVFSSESIFWKIETLKERKRKIDTNTLFLSTLVDPLYSCSVFSSVSKISLNQRIFTLTLILFQQIFYGRVFWVSDRFFVSVRIFCSFAFFLTPILFTPFRHSSWCFRYLERMVVKRKCWEIQNIRKKKEFFVATLSSFLLLYSCNATKRSNCCRQCWTNMFVQRVGEHESKRKENRKHAVSSDLFHEPVKEKIGRTKKKS